jgi:formamidopyrimidine-DNA glycosylase
MPELPEVEHLRRTLEPQLVGAEVVAVHLRRRDVVRAADSRRRGRVLPRDLLVGSRIAKLDRHGKNLAIIADTAQTICVHLGMTGQLFVRAVAPSKGRRSMPTMDHVHCIWRLRNSERSEAQLFFRDPRRFGGIWIFDSHQSLCDQRLHHLGPDALSITAAQLQHALSRTTRSIKAALLDQTVLAGVGNIYADEALFLARIHPMSRMRSIPRAQIALLARSIRLVLRDAIKAGGSSIRDYIDGHGEAGEFALRLRVYGRGGEPCLRCDHPLAQATIAQRTTVLCARCQRRYR